MKRVSWALGLVIVVSCWAVTARAESLTLAEAEKRALSASPAARIARLEVVAARERTAQAYARHLGDGDFVTYASHYEGARLVTPITGPITPTALGGMPFDRNQLHLGFSWRIPLFAGGALILGDQAARLAQRAAEHGSTYSLEEVRYNVRNFYRGALGLKHALAASVAYEEALARDDESALIKVRTEAWPAVDAAKVSFALASARARRSQIKAQLTNAMARLATLMGEDDQTDYELVDTTAEPDPSALPPSCDDLATAAQHSRRDLAGARASADAQAKRARAVRGGFWPQGAFVGSYLWNAGPSLEQPQETYELTFQLRIPLLSDVGRTFAAREADAAAAQARERERAKALEIRSQVLDACSRVAAARVAFEAGKAQRALGAEVARVEKIKLDAGSGRVDDFLTARAQKVEGETAYWQGLYALQVAYDYLALVTGNGGTP